jgi:DNA-binding NarL/FixJ family response regulator
MNTNICLNGEVLAAKADVKKVSELAERTAGRVQTPETVVVLDTRLFNRECLCRSLRIQNGQLSVVAFGSISEFLLEKDRYPSVMALIYNIGGRKVTDAGIAAEITRIVEEFAVVPVVIMAEAEDLAQIVKALELGVRGYIPSSVSIDVCLEAIKLAIVGGIFVPANSVMAMGRAIENGEEVVRPMAGVFTPRQAEVALALRRGKANKIIAHELQLTESTVKVHIRNIMRKLRATNRTEVAFKIADLLPSELGPND